MQVKRYTKQAGTETKTIRNRANRNTNKEESRNLREIEPSLATYSFDGESGPKSF